MGAGRQVSADGGQSAHSPKKGVSAHDHETGGGAVPWRDPGQIGSRRNAPSGWFAEIPFRGISVQRHARDEPSGRIEDGDIRIHRKARGFHAEARSIRDRILHHVEPGRGSCCSASLDAR